MKIKSQLIDARLHITDKLPTKKAEIKYKKTDNKIKVGTDNFGENKTLAYIEDDIKIENIKNANSSKVVDGSAGQALKTDGAGNYYFGDVIENFSGELSTERVSRVTMHGSTTPIVDYPQYGDDNTKPNYRELSSYSDVYPIRIDDYILVIDISDYESAEVRFPFDNDFLGKTVTVITDFTGADGLAQGSKTLFLINGTEALPLGQLKRGDRATVTCYYDELEGGIRWKLVSLEISSSNPAKSYVSEIFMNSNFPSTSNFGDFSSIPNWRIIQINNSEYTAQFDDNIINAESPLQNGTIKLPTNDFKFVGKEIVIHWKSDINKFCEIINNQNDPSLFKKYATLYDGNTVTLFCQYNQSASRIEWIIKNSQFLWDQEIFTYVKFQPSDTALPNPNYGDDKNLPNVRNSIVDTRVNGYNYTLKEDDENIIVSFANVSTTALIILPTTSNFIGKKVTFVGDTHTQDISNHIVFRLSVNNSDIYKIVGNESVTFKSFFTNEATPQISWRILKADLTYSKFCSFKHIATRQTGDSVVSGHNVIPLNSVGLNASADFVLNGDRSITCVRSGFYKVKGFCHSYDTNRFFCYMEDVSFPDVSFIRGSSALNRDSTNASTVSILDSEGYVEFVARQKYRFKVWVQNGESNIAYLSSIVGEQNILAQVSFERKEG